VQAVHEVRSAGFESVNCDLIYAIPRLDDARWLETLERVIALEPTHVSCYELTVEAGTPLHRAVQRGAVHTVPAGPALRQHWLAVDTLAARGYRQYEVSNFAHPGGECRHNLAYWRNEWYAAAGVGAHGHVPASLAPALGVGVDPGDVGVRYWHTRSVPEYIGAVARGGMPLQGSERIDAQTRELERRMLGLRLSDGIAFDGAPPHAAIAQLIHDGLVTFASGRLRATRRGQEVLDRVVMEVCADVAACNPGATASTIRQTVG